jgi:hypothetical protein
VVPRSWCVVLCPVCKFVSDWNGHVKGWERSTASRSSWFGSPEVCSEMCFPFCGENVYVEIIYDNKS